MIEATTADSSAAPGVQDTATPSPALALFADWCSCVKFEAPADLSDEDRDAAYDEIGDQQDQILFKIGALAMGDGVAMAAMLWISTWNITRTVDRRNPTLPNLERAPEHRRMVLAIASHHPDLARIAGLPDNFSAAQNGPDSPT
jgi:hypothetical protein